MESTSVFTKFDMIQLAYPLKQNIEYTNRHLTSGGDFFMEKGESMEVKINKDIRNYTESMFFGLSLRQFIFSAIAVAVAVFLYFVLKSQGFGAETVSWVCILGASPFAALGFIKYNGLTAEQFLWAFIKSEVLMPKKLVFEPQNTYYELMKNSIKKKQKEGLRVND